LFSDSQNDPWPIEAGASALALFARCGAFCRHDPLDFVHTQTALDQLALQIDIAPITRVFANLLEE
jgi:hypothetical protein